MQATARYREAATHALAGFQLIEESLKQYIGYYHERVRELLPDELAYRYTKKDIQDAALGKLVNLFGRMNANDDLVSKLRALVKTRDSLAHRAFLDLYGNVPSPEHLSMKASSYIEVSEEVASLLSAISGEIIKLLAVKHKS